MEHKLDRRVLRTRAALRHAMLALIEEVGYDAVTVEQIAERANIGRTTFYLHYRDKEDLLLERFTELLEDLVQQVAQIPLPVWTLEWTVYPPAPPPFQPLLLVFEHARQNASLVGLILHSNVTGRLIERFRSMITRAVSEVARQKIENDGETIQIEVPLDLLANYFAGALLACIRWWMDENMDATPQEMTVMFQKLFFPGLKRIIHVENSSG